jgi:hypothetical protein
VGTRDGMDEVAKREIPSRSRESNPACPARSLVSTVRDAPTPQLNVLKVKVKLSLCYF